MDLSLRYADLLLWPWGHGVAVLQLAELSCRQIVLLQNAVSVPFPIAFQLHDKTLRWTLRLIQWKHSG